MRFYLLNNGGVGITDDSNNLHRFFLEKTSSSANVRLNTEYRLEELVITENSKSDHPQARHIASYAKADGVKVYLASIYRQNQMEIGTQVTILPHPELQYTENFVIPYNPSSSYRPNPRRVQKVFAVDLGGFAYQEEIRKLLGFADSGDTWSEGLVDKTPVLVGSIDELPTFFKRWQMKRRLQGYGRVELEDVGNKLLKQLIG